MKFNKAINEIKNDRVDPISSIHQIRINSIVKQLEKAGKKNSNGTYNYTCDYCGTKQVVTYKQICKIVENGRCDYCPQKSEKKPVPKPDTRHPFQVFGNLKEDLDYNKYRCPACGTRQKVDFDSFLDGTASCIKCKNRLA